MTVAPVRMRAGRGQRRPSSPQHSDQYARSPAWCSGSGQPAGGWHMRGAVTFLIVAVSAVLLMAAPATAAVLSTAFPFAGTFSNPCTSELITFAGNLNIL